MKLQVCLLVSAYLFLVLVDGKTYNGMVGFPWRVYGNTTAVPKSVNPFIQKRLIDLQRFQEQLPESLPFPCDLTGTRSPVRPTNVNQLRPGDIDVIACSGDSLAAASGAGATNPIEAVHAYKRMSFACGGEGTWRTALTLPNILKVFNPNLVGYATYPDEALNGAVPASYYPMLLALMKGLVQKMKEDPRVDFERDWKMVTILIGNNDICGVSCLLLLGGDLRATFQVLRREVAKALDYLRDNLPRAIINLLLPIGAESILHAKGPRPNCRLNQGSACPCPFVFSPKEYTNLNILTERRWQLIEQELAMEERYRRDDFLVIVQPFTKQMNMRAENANELDPTLIALDCYHLTQKGHSAAGNSLWNNILEPVGNKTSDWNRPLERFICPTKEHPYIFTYENSPGGDSLERANLQRETEWVLKELEKETARLGIRRRF